MRVYAVDPGDMRTEMHQRAFPGEDISDRPLPETVVPALLRLLGRARRPAAVTEPRLGARGGGGAMTVVASTSTRSSRPPHRRGRRDGVRLLVARPGWLTHARFAELADPSAR